MYHAFRRSTTAVLATALGSILAVSPLTFSSAIAAPDDGTVVVNLMNINDFHGRINVTTDTADGVTVGIAGTVEELREQYGEENSLLLSAGDNVGASEFASAIQQDQPTIDVLNALDLAASAVGNHEFDKGFGDLTGRIVGPANAPNAEWDYLGANVYDAATGQPALPEYGTYTVAGLTVGVIGAVTQETPTLVSPAGVAGLRFGDPVEAVNRVAAQLQDGDDSNGEADIIVAEYHEGAGAVSADEALEQELAEGGVFAHIVNDTTPLVDVIFNGHTHQTYAWQAPVPGEQGKTRPVLQTGSYGSNIGQVVLTVDQTDSSVISSSAAEVPRTSTPDADLISAFPRVAEVSALTNAAAAYAAEVGATPVGSVTADITTAYSGGSYVDGVYAGGTRDDRLSESALGNLVADSLVESLSSGERGGATIGVVNPGGLRSELIYAPDGVITYAEANNVLPFVNNLWTTSLTGEQFKTALEQQWQTTTDGTEPAREFLKLGLSNNVRYTYDPDAPQGSHVTGIWIDGTPIDPTSSYRIGSFNFLLQGGDNFREFAAGEDTRDSGLIDRDAWIAYLGAHPNLAPSFERNAVQVVGTPAGPVPAGSDISFTIGALDLTSLGSPRNSALTGAWSSGETVGPIPVADGSAQVNVTVPLTAEGAVELTLTAVPSGTVVRVPIVVVADAISPTPVPSEPAGEAGASDGQKLAATGKSLEAGYLLMGGAFLLLVTGAATLALLRRRRAAQI